jgi:hypothetical protein
MRNLLIAACCAALMGSISAASAQATGPATQDSMKTNGPMPGLPRLMTGLPRGRAASA